MTTPPNHLFSAACNGVTVTADAYTALSANNHRENILYFISLIGPQAATKAVRRQHTEGKTRDDNPRATGTGG